MRRSALAALVFAPVSVLLSSSPYAADNGAGARIRVAEAPQQGGDDKEDKKHEKPKQKPDRKEAPQKRDQGAGPAGGAGPKGPGAQKRETGPQGDSGRDRGRDRGSERGRGPGGGKADNMPKAPTPPPGGNAPTLKPAPSDNGRPDTGRADQGGPRNEHKGAPTAPSKDAQPSKEVQPQQPKPPAANQQVQPKPQGKGDKGRGERKDAGRPDTGKPSGAPGAGQGRGGPADHVQPWGLPPQQQPGKPTPPRTQTGAPPPNAGQRGDRPQAGGPGSIDEIKRGRKQRVEEGGKRTIIEEPGNRTIVQEKGAPAMIRHDEGERMRRTSRDVRSERRPDGGNLTIAIRPGGIEVYSEFDSSGRLMRRYRRGRDGRDVNLIDNRRFRGEPPIIIGLRAPILHIPRDRYILDYERSSDDDLYGALMDAPVERLDRGYSLDEIRYNVYLRDRMRRVDLDTVNFDFGAWQVPYDQYSRLERIARIINRILDRQPDEVFLIEGHTDAVGSDIDNLTLSDRRAEEVAIILSETFHVPPENLITQGYGEEFLKVPTNAPERANRRVAVRRITPLLARDR